MRLVLGIILVLLSESSWAADEADQVRRGQLLIARDTLNALKTSRCKAGTDRMNVAVEVAADRIIYRQNEGLYDVAQQETVDLATTLFVVADGALKLGCRQIADQYYRQVLIIFTGASYSAYRQRALVEDVREAAKHPPSAPR